MICNIKILRNHGLKLIIVILIISCFNIFVIGYGFCIFNPDNCTNPKDIVLSDDKFKYLKDINISTFDDFKEKLLCEPKNKYPNNEILKIIYNNQFRKDCYSHDTKFLVHDITTCEIGIGSFIEAYISPVFWKAIALNRTYLIVGKWDWAKNYKYCNQSNGLECYTLPLSNCNFKNLRKYYEAKALPKNKAKNDEYLKSSNEKIFWCEKWCHFSGLNRDFVLKWLQNKHQININSIYNVNSIVFSYIFRIKSHIRNIIIDNIKRTYLDAINKSNYTNIIGWGLRHSDKCIWETECWSLTDYLNVLEGLNYINNKYNTFLITSEDHDLLNNISAQSRFNILYDKTDKYLKGGSASFENGSLVAYNDTNNLQENVVIKSLKSFVAQNAIPNTIILNRNSNWLRFILYSMNTLQCSSMFDTTPKPVRSCIETIQYGLNTPKSETDKTIVLNKELFGKMDNKTFYNKFKLFLDEKRKCGDYDMSFLYDVRKENFLFQFDPYYIGKSY